MTKQLTEKQVKFLAVLFHEAEGDIRTAMRMAGYSDSTRQYEVTGPLAKEIREETNKFLEDSGVLAASALISVINNPTALGNKEKMAAAKEVLDRAGYDKTQKVEVKGKSAVFILPPKEDEDDEGS